MTQLLCPFFRGKPICHNARKGRHTGSHWSKPVAPPLHSTSSRGANRLTQGPVGLQLGEGPKPCLYAAAILLSAGLLGCKPKETALAGQVFIVTRGAENIKLGAVEVLLI